MQYKIKHRKFKENYGSFDKDVPSHISKHMLDQKVYENLVLEDNVARINNIQLYFYKVEWKPRQNTGRRALGHYYKYQELKKLAPRLLLDYLEKLGRLIR